MNDLLEEKIYVNEECQRLIRIVYRQYTILALLFFLTSLSATILEILRIYRFKDKVFDDSVNNFNFHIIPLIALFQIFLGIIQVYHYYNAVRFQKNAITESNQLLFNKSFLFYKRGNIFSMAVLLISLFYELVFLYQHLYLS